MNILAPRIIAITGHRPEKIPDFGFVDAQLRHAFNDFNASKVIEGQASGVDLHAAMVAYQMKIPYVAVRPWKNHKGRMGGSNGFRQSDEKVYDIAIANAFEVVDISDSATYPGPWIYQKRNEWMVDHADMVVSVWDGIEDGGTWNCIKYSRKMKKRVFNINPHSYSVSVI